MRHATTAGLCAAMLSSGCNVWTVKLNCQLPNGTIQVLTCESCSVWHDPAYHSCVADCRGLNGIPLDDTATAGDDCRPSFRGALLTPQPDPMVSK